MRRLAFHEVMGVLRVGDLHPGGAMATDFLLAGLARRSPRVVLEVGAGIGLTSARMLERGWRVVAVEPNQVLRKLLQARLSIEVHPGTLESLDGPDGAYDAVIGESVFYAMDLPRTFSRIRRLLRPGGLLAFVDMVWTDAADASLVASVHDETEKTFGIAMASRTRLTWADWSRTIAEAGFTKVDERRLPAGGSRRRRRDRLRSAVAAARHPAALVQHLLYRRLGLTPRVPADWLESWMAVWQRA